MQGEQCRVLRRRATVLNPSGHQTELKKAGQGVAWPDVLHERRRYRNKRARTRWEFGGLVDKLCVWTRHNIQFPRTSNNFVSPTEDSGLLRPRGDCARKSKTARSASRHSSKQAFIQFINSKHNGRAEWFHEVLRWRIATKFVPRTL